MNQQTLSNVRSMMSALASMDHILSFPERRAPYGPDPITKRVMFDYNSHHKFDVRERLEVDIGMARFHASGVMLSPCGKKFDDSVISVLNAANYGVNSIVCVGDNVSSWVVVGKHFALEIKTAKFD